VAAGRDYIFERLWKIPGLIEGAVKGYFDWAGKADEQPRSLNVHFAVRSKHADHHASSTKPDSMAKVRADYLELAIGIDEVSATWTQKHMYG
jgi:hypothetical protein